MRTDKGFTMNSIIKTFFFIVLVSILAFSCISMDGEKTGDTSGDTAPPDESAPGEEEEKEEELVIGLSRTNIGFDPLHAYTSTEAQLYTALHEGLVTYNPFTLAPLPGLARAWDLSEDGLTWTFHLRDGAYYSNGDPVTAKDVRTSWLRFMDPANEAEYSVYYEIIEGVKEYRETGEGVENIGLTPISDKLLEVKLTTKAPHFLKLLCHMSFVVIHPEYTKSDDWSFARSLITCGPYYLLSRTKSEIVFARNNLYYNSGNVSIEKIRVLLLEDDVEITKRFNDYQIHWAFDWDPDTVDNTDFIVANPMFATSYLFFFFLEEPWSDPRVRRALTLMIPWDLLRTEDMLFPTSRLVPALSDYPEINGITEQNTEEGLSLLEEAGYPDGEGLPSPVITIPESQSSRETANIIAAAWKEGCGVEAEIKAIPHELYFEAMKKTDYTIGSMTWIGDFADPLTFLQMWTSGSNLNDAGFSNETYDNLIEKSHSQEKEERYKTLAEAEEILLNQGVILPLRHYPALNLVNLELIEGWFPNPLDIHPFLFFQFKEEKVYPGIVMAGR